MLREIGGVVQLAYVVEDLDAAMAQWNALGAGPFFVMRRIWYVEQTYRGAPSDAEVSAAFGYLGSIQIELLRPLGDSPSSFKDFQDKHRTGVQHLGILSKDIEGDAKKLEAQGYTQIQRMLSATGAETILFEVSDIEGTVIELIGETPEIRDGFAQMKAAADSWDVSQPGVIELQ